MCRKLSKWPGERTAGVEVQSESLLEGSIVSAIILMTLAEVLSSRNSLIQRCSLFLSCMCIFTMEGAF